MKCRLPKTPMQLMKETMASARREIRKHGDLYLTTIDKLEEEEKKMGGAPEIEEEHTPLLSERFISEQTRPITLNNEAEHKKK